MPSADVSSEGPNEAAFPPIPHRRPEEVSHVIVCDGWREVRANFVKSLLRVFIDIPTEPLVDGANATLLPVPLPCERLGPPTSMSSGESSG